MKYVAIDYGTKRTGIALSDESGRIAFARETRATNDTLIEHVTKLCADEHVGAIVIGKSADLKGNDNPITEALRTFGDALKARTKLSVEYEWEFMTTRAAIAEDGAGEMLDAHAAALILQRYLDKKQHEQPTGN